jgi:hypothetical protein
MFEGTFTNGTVVFSEPPALEEGTVVEVVVKKKEPEQDREESKPTFLGLLKLAGAIKDMPADFAEEHNHYIHGTTRRKPLVSE